MDHENIKISRQLKLCVINDEDTYLENNFEQILARESYLNNRACFIFNTSLIIVIITNSDSLNKIYSPTIFYTYKHNTLDTTYFPIFIQTTTIHYNIFGFWMCDNIFLFHKINHLQHHLNYFL